MLLATTRRLAPSAMQLHSRPSAATSAAPPPPAAAAAVPTHTGRLSAAAASKGRTHHATTRHGRHAFTLTAAVARGAAAGTRATAGALSYGPVRTRGSATIARAAVVEEEGIVLVGPALW